MINIKEIIRKIIDSQNISFIGSIDEKGYPNIRAMLRPRKYDEVSTIYFSTNTPSSKVQHFIDNDKSCVYICDSVKYKGVLLKGHIEVLYDNESKEMLWANGDEVYYPLGITDPNYCVLKFVAHSGRYFTNLKSEDFTF